MEVPSGQRVAHAMALPVLAPATWPTWAASTSHNRTPLWFYILREAQVTADGEHLGPVGGRIVAEVIIGLIQGDQHVLPAQDPDWTPTYGHERHLHDGGSAPDRRRRRDAPVARQAA